MVRPKRSMKVFDETLMVLKKAKIKYRKPVIEIMDALVMQTQALSELDKIFDDEKTTSHYKLRKSG